MENSEGLLAFKNLKIPQEHRQEPAHKPSQGIHISQALKEAFPALRQAAESVD
jgi:hypothetical protein